MLAPISERRPPTVEPGRNSLPAPDPAPAPVPAPVPPARVETVFVPLPAEEADATPYAALLDEEETERAGRFLVAHARIAFVVTRGVLRLLLGARSGRDPRSLRFSTGPEGKPELVSEAGRPTLHFNVSHTTDLAAVALSFDAPVGIDVEWRNSRVDIRHLIASLHPALAPPPEASEAASWRCWVRTEAALKALGLGIGNARRLPDLEATRPGRIVLRPDEVAPGTVLHLADLDAGPRHAACLAVAAPFDVPSPDIWSHREGHALARGRIDGTLPQAR